MPDTELPGNSAGITVSPVSLAGLNTGALGTANYTSIRIAVTATTANLLETPSAQDWKVKYERHTPKTAFTFGMRGAKTIGTDGGGAPVYKYNQNFTTDGNGMAATTSLEWDTYTLSIPASFDIAESCPPQPPYVAPNTTVTTYMDLAADTTHSILVRVVNNAGVEQTDALVRLWRTGYNNTKSVGQRCAQAFWPGMSEGTVVNGDAYSIDVSMPPHTATTTVLNVDVSGYSYAPIVAN